LTSKRAPVGTAWHDYYVFEAMFTTLNDWRTLQGIGVFAPEVQAHRDSFVHVCIYPETCTHSGVGAATC